MIRKRKIGFIISIHNTWRTHKKNKISIFIALLLCILITLPGYWIILGMRSDIKKIHEEVRALEELKALPTQISQTAPMRVQIFLPPLSLPVFLPW